jgi:hypothetical protein
LFAIIYYNKYKWPGSPAYDSIELVEIRQASSTTNIQFCFSLYNQGKVKSTKAYRPWRLLEYYEYITRAEAVKAERFYKSHHQKEILKNKYNLN